jgi:hypothetical protein
VGDSHQFSVDVFRTVCDRLAENAAVLGLLAESGASFEGWLNREAFLACKLREATYPFCEVTAEPGYASEGVPDEGDPNRNFGDLRVGGPNDGADHCWVFAEFALLHGGNRAAGEWRRKIEGDAEKLKRLGWKKSASLLVVVVARRGDVPTNAVDDLAGCAVWTQPALTDPFTIALPDGGSVLVNAFNIKRDPAHTLAEKPH